MLRTLLTILTLCLYAAGAWADATIPTKDQDGTRDHPLLKRYEGSFIVAHDGKSFDEFSLPTGPLKADADRERRDQHNNHWFAPEKVLTEIAALLKGNPALKLLVVGHTDNAGNFDYNRTLSQRRAEAVVATLAKDYKADKARLLPVGVSFAAPLASNQSEEGRAQNRRVELVQYQ